MKKADYQKALIEAGKTEEEVDVKVADLKKMYKELGLGESEAAEEYDKKPVRIISKRRDGTNCYWLENGAKVKWEDCSKYFPKENAMAPLHKAKDYCQRTKDGIKLFFRNEVVEAGE